MLSSEVLPKIVCCLKECKEGERVLLEAMEQLVVRGVSRVRIILICGVFSSHMYLKVHRSRLKSKKALKVFSLRTKSEFYLPEDCPALFSTESTMVKMLIADMVQHISEPFPSGAMVHLNADLYQNPATSRKVGS